MPHAKFLKGSVFKHIVVMSSTNAIGLTALFFVDLIDLFFISLLGEIELAAAVGYAGTLSFFTTSVAIGISIAMTALVSKAIGEKNKVKAGRLALNIAVAGFIFTSLFAAIMWFYIPELLQLLGARGQTLAYAIDYMQILLPSLPVLSLAMSAGAALRSVGDARRAMFSTLTGGGVNAVLDPIFIFALALDIHGAALASVAARFAMLAVGLSGVIYKHKLTARFRFSPFVQDLPAICKVAGPAMLTNIATPFGNAYVTSSIAQFGDGFVAGWAIIGRVLPVAFGMIFSLSGAIGPIIGQNFGAGQFDRVRETLNESLKFLTLYVLTTAMFLSLSQDLIIRLFSAGDDAATLIRLFCQAIAFTFIFAGAQFVANAAFNNLGFASYSTITNTAKATLGTIPFVYVGAKWFGPEGVLYGQALGNFIFGILTVLLARRVVNKLAETHKSPEEPPVEGQVPLNAFTSSRVYLCTDTDDNESPPPEYVATKQGDSDTYQR